MNSNESQKIVSHPFIKGKRKHMWEKKIRSDNFRREKNAKVRQYSTIKNTFRLRLKSVLINWKVFFFLSDLLIIQNLVQFRGHIQGLVWMIKVCSLLGLDDTNSLFGLDDKKYKSRPGSLGVCLVFVFQGWRASALTRLQCLLLSNLLWTCFCEILCFCEIWKPVPWGRWCCARDRLSLSPCRRFWRWSGPTWSETWARQKSTWEEIILQPTCLASVGACSGCSWWALPRSWGLVEPPLLDSPHPCHPFPLPRC